MLHRLLERAEHRREHALGGQHRADRHVATGKRLGDRDDVGAQIPVLVAEELAGAAEPGLHLVDHQQRLVLAAQRLRLVPVLRRRLVDALALDRLDDEGGDVAPHQRLVQRVDVAERHRLAAGQQLPETLAEFRAAVQRQRTGASARGRRGRRCRIRWRPVACRANLMADSMASAPELQKKTRLISSSAARHQLLGEQPRQQRAVHLHHVRQVEVDGLVQRRLERRVAAAERVNPEAGKEIEVALALGVDRGSSLRRGRRSGRSRSS